MSDMVSVSGLCFSYGRRQILKDVSLTACKGQCVGIAGANGCGKSTLLSILAGARRASCGSVCYDGKDALRDRRVFASCTGYVPQDNPLIEELTVLDNLRLWYGMSAREIRREIGSGLLSMLDMEDFLKRPVSKLSGGMKKRVNIACALRGDPKVLILDEPGSSLDIVCKNDVLRYLKACLGQGTTVLLASHEESELSLCDKLYILEDGILSQIPRGAGVRSLAALLSGHGGGGGDAGGPNALRGTAGGSASAGGNNSNISTKKEIN